MSGAYAGMDDTFVILEFEKEAGADAMFVDNATAGRFWKRSRRFASTSQYSTPSRRRPSPEVSIEMIEMLVEEPLWKSKQRVSG